VILSANRDEFYNRPTAPLAFWQDQPDILAGRDLQQNGTWMGITKTGRFAAITNFRDPSLMGSAAPSRGLLVSHFLASDQRPEQYLQAIKDSGKKYNGFNLVVGDMKQLWWYSNKKNDIVKIEPGIHVISNHLMDTPWPKTQKALAGMQEICSQNTAIDPEDIFQILADKNQPPDNELPDTGVGLEWERLLSPVFISSDIYGTRSSAVILAEPSDQIRFVERTFTPRKDVPAIEETREVKMMVS
jgi:uncharacterized protein with NRDE domain